MLWKILLIHGDNPLWGSTGGKRNCLVRVESLYSGKLVIELTSGFSIDPIATFLSTWKGFHHHYITCPNCHKSLKNSHVPLIWHQHQHGTVIHVTGHVMCHITHHMSHITCHKCHKSLENSPGPLVGHHFGNVTTPASTLDCNTCHMSHITCHKWH